MKRAKLFVLLVSIAIFLTNCSKPQPTQMPITQTDGDVTAVLTLLPDTPTVMNPTILSLTIKDADSQPITGASVAFDLTMPGMAMPPNNAQATDDGSGSYDAEVTFTMAGDWQIQADVTYPGGSAEFTFDLTIE
ncbi:MAG: FixH family protein [Ardenticatenaceae bacterium]|nr:FixH family protein [Ardenticatenaceae bacterium]MCB9446331.1 FixH family protein [Ardenticatenaceae bacterium]